MAAKNELQLPRALYTLATQPVTIYPPEETLSDVDLEGRIDQFGTLRLSSVSTLKQRRLWNYLIDQHHYLGLATQVGRHLKFFIYLDDQLIGAIAFADAVLKLNLRDRWIQWTPKQRSENLHLIINNTRFLILPSVRINNLASKTLALATKTVPDYWQHCYGCRPLLFETFIEKNRFAATSYRAANWICLGETIGKARSGMNYSCHGVTKWYYVYPLTKNAIDILQGECQ